MQSDSAREPPLTTHRGSCEGIKQEGSSEVRSKVGHIDALCFKCAGVFYRSYIMQIQLASPMLSIRIVIPKAL